jgi:hypothetical protein
MSGTSPAGAGGGIPELELGEANSFHKALGFKP